MSMLKEITCTVLGGLITYIVIDKFYKHRNFNGKRDASYSETLKLNGVRPGMDGSSNLIAEGE